MADEFADHKYFEADHTAYKESPDVRSRFGIIVSEKPKRNADGTKSVFMRWPALIITEYTSDAEEFAKTVAEVLQENAHRFFSSSDDSPEHRDAERYRWLRDRNLDTVHTGGVFAGQTPQNIVLNGEDLDRAIDAAMEHELLLDGREHNEMPERANG